MFFRGASHYFSGFVELRVEGSAPEKLVNLAYLRGIEFWDLRQRKGALSFSVLVEDFKDLRPLARAARCRVRIRRRVGFPFLLRRAKRRKILLIGLLAFILVLFYLSTFVWFVEVAGLKNLPPQRLLERAQELGLERGAPKSSLQLNQIERGLLDSIPELSWVKVNIHGTVAVIDAAERSLPPPVEVAGPCHVVAAKDGLIVSLLVLSGQSQVRNGDTVKKDQILISGRLGGQTVEQAGQKTVLPARLVEARGVIRARVWYQDYAETPLRQVTRIRTGRTEEREVLRIGDKEIIWKGGGPVSFPLYEEERRSLLSLQWRKSPVIVESLRIVYYELEERQQTLTVEEARVRARQAALERILAALPPGAERTEIRASTFHLDGAVGVTVTVEAIEEIGVRRPLTNGNPAR